ncbi:MAG TPA: glycoside hydrolase family 97 protein [Saprospiraceae bacterium]|nr:glycoside hydrolase family 97 protein [Saprospiraceae bacterium]HPI09137.1 glycoside hydrolase family 97 protein [Saprospiraceae bacterium]
MNHLLRFALILLTFNSLQAQSLLSPGGALRIQIQTSPALSWQLFLRDEPLTQPAPLSLTVEGMEVLGNNPVVLKSETQSIQRNARPDVRQKSATIPESFNELTLTFKGDWGVVFRAYDEGIAYRFFTTFQKEQVFVTEEVCAFRPAGCKSYYFPEEEGFYSHNERVFQPTAPTDLDETKLASLPLLAVMENDVKILVTETDLQDYPGLWMRGAVEKNGNLNGVLPYFPKTTVRTSNRDIQPVDRDYYLAKTKGTRSYPWRLFLVAEKDVQLLNNQMPWLLAEPSRLNNTAWIKPGKVSWDWWNALNLQGVDFRTGVNTETYKYFVDFAAENGLEYVILDEGWSDTGNLLLNGAVDMDALAAYAKSKKVGLILWTTWVAIDLGFYQILPYLKKWDIKGLKIDFMQRDDQEMVQFYWRMAEQCARHGLLVDYHGAHKPAGLQRTWPNVISFEGVFGLENCKWDTRKRIDPEHDVTIPFTRQVAGPMDYTPGAMLNYQKNDWSPSFNRPASMGTRCHELAKYIVFESPLQMLSDSPTNYRKEPECLQFLSKVPSVWDKTVPVAGQIGDYVIMARQAANGLWYLGAMGDWTGWNLKIDSKFLPAGEYEMEVFEDGLNADRNAQDYKRSVRRIKSGNVLELGLAKGGGYVAVFRRL